MGVPVVELAVPATAAASSPADQGPAGGNGGRTLNANTGGGVCGGYFQLLDVSTCSTSNVVQAQ